MLLLQQKNVYFFYIKTNSHSIRELTYKTHAPLCDSSVTKLLPKSLIMCVTTNVLLMIIIEL